jgi:hypothetical protein
MKTLTIKKKVDLLISSAEELLPAENIANAREFLKHNEWGEAYDLICTQLFEFSIPISQALYLSISEIGQAMMLPESEWTYLETLIS